MSDGLNNGYVHNYSNYTIDHYDSKKLAAVNKTQPTKALAVNATQANSTSNSTISTAQVGKKQKFVNDHYDGKHSDGLENGAKKHDYSTYTIDHYDNKKPDAKDVKVATPAAGVPPELSGKQAKAQTEATPEVKAEAPKADAAKPPAGPPELDAAKQATAQVTQPK